MSTLKYEFILCYLYRDLPMAMHLYNKKLKNESQFKNSPFSIFRANMTKMGT